MTLLFEAEARDIDPADLARERSEQAAADPEIGGVPPYAGELIDGVAANLDRIDDSISGYLHDWTLDRLPAVDRAILRVALYELFDRDDVPPVVVVDEAIELARALSTDDSPTFVNGVLGQAVVVAPQVRAAAAAVARPQGAAE